LKIDLHVHASERSGCATSSEENQIRAAISAGLDAIAFTDHHHLIPISHLVELNRKYAPFKVFSGIEITAGSEDWLVYGINHPRLEREDWHYPTLVNFVRRAGGFIVLAHPFRFSTTIQQDIETHIPDGIEIRSQNTPEYKEPEIRHIASRLGLVPMTNSDSHTTTKLGKFFNNFPVLPVDDLDLIAQLSRMKIPAPSST
jgi:predicted metal-dependent phosphoesterase TrpH